MFATSEASDLNEFVQGGQLYLSFPFSKASLVELSLLKRHLHLLIVVTKSPTTATLALLAAKKVM